MPRDEWLRANRRPASGSSQAFWLWMLEQEKLERIRVSEGEIAAMRAEAALHSAPEKLERNRDFKVDVELKPKRRQKLTWTVFNNRGISVAVFDHEDETTAREHARQLTAELGAAHYVGLVKVPVP